jgi:hypothetical protein
MTHEALWPSDLFTQGIGWVIVARFKSGGQRAEAGIFLVDVFCLGAKLAVYEATDTEDYRRRIRDHYVSRFPMVPIEAVCARKLVEEAAQCAQEFTFGCKGKPFYRRGPRETEAQARQIVEHLQRRCGPGNFDCWVMLGEAEEINRFFGDETPPPTSRTL